MEPSIISLIPALVVLAIGGLTQRIITALLCGIASAAFLATSGVTDAIRVTLTRIVQASEIEAILSFNAYANSQTLLLFTFLIVLSILVTLLEQSGSASAYTKFMSSRLTQKHHVENASIGLSFFLCIDDYFSTLTVGNVMRPLADAVKLPRAKMAYLVDTFAAPLVLIVPTSSWIGYILGQLSKSGIAPVVGTHTYIIGDPFEIYLQTIPFISYSLIALLATLLVVWFGISFGPMADHEQHANETGNLCNGKESPETIEPKQALHAHVLDFFAPLVLLIGSVLSGMLWSGSWSCFGGTKSLLIAFQSANAMQVLVIASALTLTITTIHLALRRLITKSDLVFSVKEGVQQMIPTVIILTLAWAFGDLLKYELGTGQYLAQLLTGKLPVVYFPLLTFIVSGVLGSVIGSSWGVIALMLPLCLPLFVALTGATGALSCADAPLLFPFLGALFSGAIMGDHLSPFASTTAVVAASSGSHLVDHILTQLAYGACFIIGTMVSIQTASFLALTESLGFCAFASILAGLTVSYTIMFFLSIWYKRTHYSNPSERA